jgi:hypothetical protein
MMPQESPATGVASSTAVEDFLGSAQLSQPMMPPETPQPVIAPQLDPQGFQPTPTIIQPEGSEQEESSTEEERTTTQREQQAPQPNTQAPPVPPPLLPQAPMQPQFFDADGNNQNPFLNPS